MDRVPLIDVGAPFRTLLPEMLIAFRRVLESGQFVRANEVASFQLAAAHYLGVRRTVGVANGTDALVVALDALGIGEGDEVICPAFTFFATAEAIAQRGAVPVFADIEEDSMTIDPDDVVRKITRKTRAIIAVHLFGRMASIERLEGLGVPVIEDAAQAFGASNVGARGAVATFSFYPTKNMFCLGDGGLIASNDEELAERAQILAFHGSRDKTTFELVGYNSRLDEIQAAILQLFLPHTDDWNAERRNAAARYRSLGLESLVEVPSDSPEHIYHLFVIRSDRRDELAAALREKGIASAAYYTTPLHLQPVFRHLGYAPGSLPVTERTADRNLALPLWAGIGAHQQALVVNAVLEAAR